MTNNGIEYIKNKLIEEIEILKPYISEMKYELYKTVIDNYNSLEDIREIADLDLEVDCIQYILDINETLKYSDTSIDELEEIITGTKKGSNIKVIRPKAAYNSNIITEEEISSIADDMNNNDMLKIISHLINKRVKEQENQPTFTEQMQDMELDNLLDELDEFEEDEEIPEEEENDSDELDSALDEMFNDYIEEEDEPDEEDDLDSVIDEMFIEEEEIDDEDTDDDLDDALDSLFVEEEDEQIEEDDSELDSDLDSALDEMFIEEKEEDSDSEEDYDLDSALDEMFVEGECVEEDAEDNNDNDLDSILDDALDDEFDIDESNLGLEDSDEVPKQSLSTDVKKNETQISKQKIRKINTDRDKIFIDGTVRGEETQQMFNVIMKLYDKIPNINKAATIKWREYNEKRNNNKTASRVFKQNKRD